jgi:quercetin dioxygenase-like cupin family protein
MSDQEAPEAYFEMAPITAGTHDVSGGSIIPMDAYPKYEIAAGLIFCPVFAENLSLNFVTFPPESGFPTHTHPEEQISIIREGEIEMTIGDTTKLARPGDVVIFPSDVPHSGRTFDAACRVIDIFSPPRRGMLELLATANPLRSSDSDRWWKPEGDEPPSE